MNILTKPNNKTLVKFNYAEEIQFLFTISHRYKAFKNITEEFLDMMPQGNDFTKYTMIL